MSKLLVIACLLVPSLVALAQTPAAPAPPAVPAVPVPPVPPVPPPVFASGDDVMMFVSSELGGRTVVKGAPYSATAVNESKQILSDGNRIERSSTIRLYRDGQGRTRQEQPSGVVFINDVVAGKRYILNTQRKSARELRMSSHAPLSSATTVVAAPTVPPLPAKPHSQMSPEETRSWAEEMRRWAREFSERMRGEQERMRGEQERMRGEQERMRERNVIIARSAASDGLDISTDRVEVVQLDGVNAPLAPLPPMTMSPPPGPGTTTTLGSREFDGVRADGKKTTWTIPAGRIGNKLPIEIVSERWYSPELNVVVLSRHADPRSGERIYRLESIKREEPSTELFKVPADFAVKTPTERR